MAASHHVIFSFQLPPALLLHVEPGRWPGSTRGCNVDVTPGGAVTVTSLDHSQSYGCKAVIRLATAFLRESVRHPPCLAIGAELSAPYCRDRPERFQISFGAKVSIAQTGVQPILVDERREPAPRRGYRGLRLVTG